MKLRVGETVYDVANAIHGAKTGDIRALKKSTRGAIDIDNEDGTTSYFFGATPKTMVAAFKKFPTDHIDSRPDEELTEAELEAKGEQLAELSQDMMSDSEYLLHVEALIYLARLKAGETVDFKDCSVPIDEFSFVSDDDDEDEVEADPKAPTSVAPEPEPPLV